MFERESDYSAFYVRYGDLWSLLSGIWMMVQQSRCQNQMRGSKGFWLSWQRGASMCVPTNHVNASSWSPLPYVVYLWTLSKLPQDMIFMISKTIFTKCFSVKWWRTKLPAENVDQSLSMFSQKIQCNNYANFIHAFMTLFSYKRDIPLDRIFGEISKYSL